MSSVKMSGSGRAVQFIDDNGVVFQTSLYDFNLLFSGKKSFLSLIRLPFTISPTRFPPSRVAVLGSDGSWSIVDGVSKKRVVPSVDGVSSNDSVVLGDTLDW